MIAPRIPISYKGAEYFIRQRGEAWVIDVAGGEYFLTLNDDPTRAARTFFHDRMRNVAGEELRHPSLIASQRYPLMLSVDEVPVRAWPAFVPRGRGAKTYENQLTGERVLAVKEQLAWTFAAPGRPISLGGTTNYQQTVDDVVDMAKVWLRATDG